MRRKGLSRERACGDDVGRCRRRSGWHAAARRRQIGRARAAGTTAVAPGTAERMQRGARAHGVVLAETGLRRAGGRGAGSGGARLRVRVRV